MKDQLLINVALHHLSNQKEPLKEKVTGRFRKGGSAGSKEPKRSIFLKERMSEKRRRKRERKKKKNTDSGLVKPLAPGPEAADGLAIALSVEADHFVSIDVFIQVEFHSSLVGLVVVVVSSVVMVLAVVIATVAVIIVAVVVPMTVPVLVSFVAATHFGGCDLKGQNEREKGEGRGERMGGRKEGKMC